MHLVLQAAGTMKPEACRKNIFCLVQIQTLEPACRAALLRCLSMRQAVSLGPDAHPHAQMQECEGEWRQGEAPNDTCPGGHKHLALELRQRALPARSPRRVVLHGRMP